MKDGVSPDAAIHRTIIIIGADGFIGSALCSHFRDSGWSVRPAVFDRPPRTGEIRLDVTSARDFSALPGNVPLINASGLPDQNSSTSRMRKVHVGGMRNIIRWARGSACPHIIHLSSVSVYGNATVGTGRVEKTTRRILWNPLLASLPYGRTKARAEALLEGSGLPWSAPRLPAVYGPGDSFFTRQIRRLLEDSGRPLPPGGDKPVSIMPVNSIGPMIESILKHGPLNRALNAAAAVVSWRLILDAYSEAWGILPSYGSRRRLKDFLDFSKPGRQMAAYYSLFGAEFPDGILRELIDWHPDEDWKDTVEKAASEFSPPISPEEVIPF